MQPVHQQCRRAGLALIELLTVIAIILLLLGIIIPMFVEARERSNQFHCQNNLMTVGQALLAEVAQARGVPSADRPFEPRPDNASAAIYRLMRWARLSPELLVCPNTEGAADLDPATVPQQTDFTDPCRNLSYSMHFPLLSTARRPRLMDPNLAIMADLNPGIVSENDNVLSITRTSPTEQIRWGNSSNHSKRGQNVLYADGRVEFAQSPFAGVKGDNIYATRRNTVLDYPADDDDSILLPTDDRALSVP